VLFVAIAVCMLAVLVGLGMLLRSAMRVSRRLRRLRELTASGTVLVVQAQELSARAARLRAEGERLRALAHPFL
jgi:predicted exporter